MKILKEFGGFYFPENTSYLLKECIIRCYENKQRVRLWYGDALTGKSWNEENDICGYIGKSTGAQKVPLLINSNRSLGGGAISVDSVLKIVDIKTGKILYQHENFNQSVFIAEPKSEIVGYTAKVKCDNMIYANCKTLLQAERLADFMNGKRHSK